MQKTFKHYYNQNQLLLKLVLLPFIITFWLIKKLVQFITKRLTHQKH